MLKRLAKFLFWFMCLLLVGVLGVYFIRPDWLLDGEYARWALLAGAHRREVAAAGHRVAYFEAGTGTPIVLVHGFSGSKENWLPLARDLPLTDHVYMPDLPGWGESERLPDADYGIEPQVERLLAVLDALHLARVHLVGHSMGGQVAGLFAARHPERLLSLTLVDTAGVRFHENAFAKRVLAGATPFNFSSREEFWSFMHELFQDPPWLPPRVVDVLVARNRASHEFQRTLLERLKGEPEALRLEGVLDQIRVPTLVLWCQGDQLLDVSSVETIRHGLTRAPLETKVLEGCGHMPMMERPGPTATALLSFLERHSERR